MSNITWFLSKVVTSVWQHNDYFPGRAKRIPPNVPTNKWDVRSTTIVGNTGQRRIISRRISATYLYIILRQDIYSLKIIVINKLCYNIHKVIKISKYLE